MWLGIGGGFRIGLAPNVRRDTRLAIKRAIDIVGAGSLLILTSPLLALGALWVLIDAGRPIFFLQKRTGLDGRVFTVVKLRSLQVHSIKPMELGQVDESTPFLTRSGRTLRRLRVDELPQLLNVLGGDMSLVGPRPVLPEHALTFDEHQNRRFMMRPGLTGWAQVNGNTQLTWDDRIALDIWYVDHWTLKLDLQVLISTLRVLRRGELVDHNHVDRAKEHESSSRRRS